MVQGDGESVPCSHSQRTVTGQKDGKRYAIDEAIEWQEKSCRKGMDRQAGWSEALTCVVAASHSLACLGLRNCEFVDRTLIVRCSPEREGVRRAACNCTDGITRPTLSLPLFRPCIPRTLERTAPWPRDSSGD
jgi:hypothetical protein